MTQDFTMVEINTQVLDSNLNQNFTTLENVEKETAATMSYHISNKNNPHNTTASQVGAYTISQTDAALSLKANVVDLTTEVIRAEVAENTISTNLANEIVRAETTEASKVDKIVGKNLSTNDLTNELKSGYDIAATDAHTHSNKQTLDAINQSVATTASPTFASATIGASSAILKRTSGVLTDAVAGTDYLTYNNISKKNLLINGCMRVSQRYPVGTSATLTTTPTYVLDRWTSFADVTTISAGTIQKVTNSNGFAYGMKFTGVTMSGGNQNLAWHQRIESKNAIYLANQIVSISMDIYQDTGNTVNVYFMPQIPTAVDNYVNLSNGTIVGRPIANNTKTRIKMENIALGDCSNGLHLNFWANMGAITNKNLIISNIQLEVSPTATSFEYRPISEEIALCQRYFLRLKSTNGNPYFMAGQGYAYNTGTTGAILIPISSAMRILPTVTIGQSFIVQGAGATYGTGVSLPVTALSVTDMTANSIYVAFTVDSGLQTYMLYTLLSANNTSAYLDFNAE